MTFISFIIQDAEKNKGNSKGKMILLLFRLASLVASRKYLKYPFFLYLLFYKVIVEWFLGIELPWETNVGRGLVILHGQSTVVNSKSIIGKNCTIRQCTTIGNSKKGGASPVIGNNVEIGANVCILGDISIGDDVIIGAGSVVVKSVPSRSLIVGNPAKVIKQL